MADNSFTPADFFSLAQEAAAQESALRIKEAEALADVRIKLAREGIIDQVSQRPE